MSGVDAHGARVTGRADALECSWESLESGYTFCYPADAAITTTRALCVNSPFGDSPVTVVELTEPLSDGSFRRSGHELLHPWAIELEDGTRCRFIAGAGGGVLGVRERLNYDCGPPGSSLAAPWLVGFPLVHPDGSWSILKVVPLIDPRTGGYVFEPGFTTFFQSRTDCSRANPGGMVLSDDHCSGQDDDSQTCYQACELA